MKNYLQSMERPPLFRCLLVIPLVAWIILYASAPAIPTSVRPAIDVHSLYDFDVFFLRYLPSTYLASLQCTFLDVLGAIAYTLHSGWPVVFLAYMTFFKRRDLILPYVNCFGTVCLIGLITQLVLPTAPPWYFYKYGFDTTNATYTLKGDPAGLERVDAKFHISFYKNMFDSSPVVFGSFPSLHVGWPTILALFVLYNTTLPKALKIGVWVYVTYVSLAVMYLQHHYAVDVAGGLFYSIMVYKFIGPKKQTTIDQVEYSQV
jgi:membrane-associated phospholipid phosphatase